MVGKQERYAPPLCFFNMLLWRNNSPEPGRHPWARLAPGHFLPLRDLVQECLRLCVASLRASALSWLTRESSLSLAAIGGRVGHGGVHL